MYVGIDVAGERIHCVRLDADARVEQTRVFGRAELGEVSGWLAGARVVAIDAPAQLSTAPHRGDPAVNAKFQTARCAEIALGREHGSWVPWVTPTVGGPTPGWMATGFAVYEALRDGRYDVLEVYPHAGFRALARGSPLPRKQTADGLRARIALLESAGASAEHLPMWSHDGLDALLAALIALQSASGHAVRVTCGHDDSAIWLPQPVE